MFFFLEWRVWVLGGYMGKWNMICGTRDMGSSGNVDLGISASQSRDDMTSSERIATCLVVVDTR